MRLPDFPVSSNLFWGVVVKPRKRYEQRVKESFHISKACLEPIENGKEVNTVYLEHNGDSFILCNLKPNHLNESLDLNFTKGEKICFRIQGNGTVHLTGYLTPEEFKEQESTDDSSSFEDSDRMEINLPILLQNGNSKSNGIKKKDNDIKGKPLEQNKRISKKHRQLESNTILPELNNVGKDESLILSGSSFFDSTAVEDEEESELSDSDEDVTDDSFVLSGSSFFDSTAMEDESKDTLMESEDGEKDEEKEEEEGESEESDEEYVDQTSVVQINGSFKNSGNIEHEKRTKVNGAMKNNKDDSLTKKGDKRQKHKELEIRNKNEDIKSVNVSDGIKEASIVQQPGKNSIKTPKRTLKGGVIIEDSKVGTGPDAVAGKKVGVHYEGKLKSNNKVFDSQREGKPFTFKLGRGEVIKGWDVGIEGMKVGGKRKITVPSKLGYGSKGAQPDVPPNSDLVFEIECKMVK